MIPKDKIIFEETKEDQITEAAETDMEEEQSDFFDNRERMKAFLYAIGEFILVLNGFLVVAGKNPIPLDEVMVTELGSYVLAGIGFFSAVWKNHNFTKAAQKAQAFLRALREDGEGDF